VRHRKDHRAARRSVKGRGHKYHWESRDGFQRSGDYEALHYVDRQIDGWLNVERVHYAVILKNDRVVQYGQGKLIERGTGEPPFVLLRQR